METLRKKKLLILCHCFYPSKNRGGPTVSVTNLVKSLADKFEISVLTTIFEKGTHDQYTSVKLGKNRLFGSDVYYLEEETPLIIWRMIDRIAPDIIYVSSFYSVSFSLPAMLYRMWKRNIKFVLAPRGEFMRKAQENGKWKKRLYISLLKMIGAFRGIQFHVTSRQEAQDLEEIFPNHSVFVIGNLSLLQAGDILRPEKVSGKLRILTLGRIHPIKNIDYAIHILAGLYGEIIFDIYGPKEDDTYFQHCMNIARELPQNIRVNYCGAIQHDDLQKLYENYHVYFSPTQTENYGHSIVEAMRCHCPVVISDRTPWTEVNGQGGFAVKLKDKNAFVRALQAFVDMDNQEYAACCDRVFQFISEKDDTGKTVLEYCDMLGAEGI